MKNKENKKCNCKNREKKSHEKKREKSEIGKNKMKNQSHKNLQVISNFQSRNLIKILLQNFKSSITDKSKK
jgi:hypothetical protein